MFEMKTDKEKKKLEIYLNGCLLKELDKVEANSFFETVENEKIKNGHLFEERTNWEKVTIEDIKNEIGSIEKIKGLDFQMEKLVRCFPEAHVSLSVLYEKENGELVDQRLWEVDIDGNFSAEQLYFGPITNHHLRTCLDDKLIEFIEEVSGFKVFICGMEESVYEFFDSEETREYEAEISYDT